MANGLAVEAYIVMANGLAVEAYIVMANGLAIEAYIGMANGLAIEACIVRGLYSYGQWGYHPNDLRYASEESGAITI